MNNEKERRWGMGEIGISSLCEVIHKYVGIISSHLDGLVNQVLTDLF
jgi:hypothetical protein